MIGSRLQTNERQVQQASSVDKTTTAEVGILSPFLVDFHYAHPIVALQGPCKVQGREGQRNCVLIVIQIDFLRTRDGFVKHHLAIHLVASFHVDTVDQHLRQLQRHFRGWLIQQTKEVTGLEYHYMVERLHNNQAVLSLNSTTVDERLVGDVVLIVEVVNLLHLTIYDTQTGNAVAGAYPHVAIVVFHDAVNHAVEQSVLTRVNLRCGLGCPVEEQTV